jgi:flagellar biosynthesis protein FliQ
LTNDIHVPNPDEFVPAKKEDAMTASDAIDLVRDAIMMALILGAPLLVIGMIVGLAIGLIQALTQIQDQTVSTVPKLVAMTLAILICLPWLTDRMVDYSRDLIRDIPIHVAKR